MNWTQKTIEAPPRPRPPPKTRLAANLPLENSFFAYCYFLLVLGVKLFHHKFTAGLVAKEKGSVSRKGTDHGGGQTRV